MGLGGFFKDVFKSVKSVLGIAEKDTSLADAQKEELERDRQRALLDSANEANNVTQIDSLAQESNFTNDDNRRKKQAGGSFSSGIGLEI